MAINRVDITKLFFARVRHKEDKFCFFLIMKKNIPGFSDFLVVFQRSYIKTKAQKINFLSSIILYVPVLYVLLANKYKIFFYIIKTRIQRLFNRYRYRKHEISFDSHCIHGSRIILPQWFYTLSWGVKMTPCHIIEGYYFNNWRAVLENCFKFLLFLNIIHR